MTFFRRCAQCVRNALLGTIGSRYFAAASPEMTIGSFVSNDSQGI